MTSWMERSLAFYAAYHTQVFLLNAPEIPNGVAQMIPFDCNYCLILSVCYALYYAWIEQPGIAGPFAAALVMIGYFVTSGLNDQYPDLWKPALALHIFAWAAQIFGHQVFEKRAPAFLDNLLQAIVMAPLFVVLEVFFIFGYKKNLHDRVQALAQEDIKEFRKNQNTKSK